MIEALNIEAATNISNQFKQNNVSIKQFNAKEYCFTYAYTETPQSCFYGLSLSLTSSDGEVIKGVIGHFQTGTSQLFFYCNSELNINERYSIRYEANRYLIDLCIDALRSVECYQLKNFFSTFIAEVKMLPKRNIKGPKKWFNDKVSDDVKQKDAVKMILSESAYPYPFVISGGPGTGKTSVLVETVVQIIHNKSRANMLITCQSNAACDEVAIRLLNFLPAVKVFRYYSYKYFQDFKDKQENYSKDSYFEKLFQNATIKKRSSSTFEYVNPTRESLAAFKIVVATLTASVSLIRNDIAKDHFDFIFIDECGAAIEPETLIPIVSLGMQNGRVNANIILVGDHKLLGPILNSYFAKHLGLGKYCGTVR